MIRYDAGTTNPTLLNRLGDWRDHEAWVDFVTRYDPVIRSISGRYRLDAESTEELCQRVWIDLARRMRTYHYDPGKTFRGWLRRLCQSRAIDLLRKRKANAVEWLEDHSLVSFLEDTCAGIEVDETAPSERPLLLRQAEEVQDAIRRRVGERTWQVFWNIAILGQSVRETSAASGISYYAAFAARKRVGRMLREEGQRLLLAQPRELGPDARRTGD
jgi:RNA polymerase sigma factor (sigma-70 family)